MVEWRKVDENSKGIKTMAFKDNKVDSGYGRIVGYNGILKGDKVSYLNEVYTVVMVSRLGHMGLSKTGELPYIEVAYPNNLIKLGESKND